MPTSGWQLSPAVGQVTLPRQFDESTMSTSLTPTVGTCVLTTRCTIGCSPVGLFARPVTVMSTSWKGPLPATRAIVVGKTISLGST
jgi:hypothetical protein